MRSLILAGTAALLIVFGLWNIAVPESLISDLLRNSLHDSDMYIDAGVIEKGIFYDFTSNRISLKKADRTLLSIENVEADINPLTLLLMRLTVRFRGEAGGGGIRGTMNLLAGKDLFIIKLDGADIGKIPFFGLLDLKGKGALSGEFGISKGSGDVKFRVDDLRLAPSLFSGISVPLDMFSAARGAMSVKGNSVRITSFAFEGKGVYARLSGYITGGQTNLTMELMPEKTFEEKNPLLLLLGKYKVSPGYYSLPVKGPLPL